MTDWQLRVIAERDDLKGKLHKLGVWLGSEEGNKPGTDDHSNAILQYSGMEMYLQALEKRVSAFKEQS